MTEQKLKVSGMHCGSCAMSIDDELEGLEGVKGAKTSYRKQETKVSFDEKQIAIGAIVDVIAKLGYTATPA